MSPEWRGAGGSAPQIPRHHRAGQGQSDEAIEETIDIVLAVGTQVAAALAFLHKNRVLHGDLKPANVLIEARLPQRGACYKYKTHSLNISQLIVFSHSLSLSLTHSLLLQLHSCSLVCIFLSHFRFSSCLDDARRVDARVRKRRQ